MSNVPNVVISNPKARKVARTVLDVAGLTIGTVVVVDAATPLFDVLYVTVPAMAGYTFLRGAFGLGVDNPNTPTDATYIEGKG